MFRPFMEIFFISVQQIQFKTILMHENIDKMSVVAGVAVMFCVLCGCSVHGDSVLCHVTPRGKQYVYMD
jgi:hypothetical protein